jgi:hypothetical protein
VHKVIALKQTATDPRLPKEERDAARDAILILANAEGPEREAAQAAIRELGIPVVPRLGDPSSLMIELLAFVNASSLADVEDSDVYAFLDARGLPPHARESLFLEFTAWKMERDPGYQAERLRLRRTLRAYFRDRLDYLLLQFRTTIDSGQERECKATRTEIIDFCHDWQDSCVVPDEAKVIMREILGAENGK